MAQATAPGQGSATFKIRHSLAALAAPSEISRDTFIGNQPLRCQRCGNTTPIIGVKHHNRT